MLSRPQDFAALQGAGTTKSHPLFTARFVRTDLPTTRVGLSTGRRLGGAVVRNRARRRLREALRVMTPAFQPGWDSVTALENWVENGTAPANQVITDGAGVPGRTRPLCEYPLFPKYKGGGLNVNLASSFSCASS